MNRLKILRELSGATEKQLSKLLGVTVYTYRAYESERMAPGDVEIAMIAKIYNIPAHSVFGSEAVSDDQTAAALRSLKELSEHERYRQMIFNLCGEHRDSLSFAQICEIRNRLSVNPS